MNVGNPALEAFVAQIGDEFVLAEVLIRRKGAGFELRHVEDREVMSADAVTANDNPERIVLGVKIRDLRYVAQQVGQGGAFRPLKSAPNLSRGWRAEAREPQELGLALNYLYPGAVADWFAVRSGKPPVTNYREFTARQTGMYRITNMLSDAGAADATRACCDRKFCLKQRLWTVPGLATDDARDKSAIPCLEPCAIMLEFARKAMRMEQEEKTTFNLSKSELETLIAGLETARGDTRPTEIKEADFGHALNPRRVELLLNKLKSGMLGER